MTQKTARYAGSGTRISSGLLRALEDVAGICDDLQEARWDEPERPPRVPWRRRAALVPLHLRHSHQSPYPQLRAAALLILVGALTAAAVVLLLTR